VIEWTNPVGRWVERELLLRDLAMRIGVSFFLASRALRESLLSTGLLILAVAVAIGFEVPSAANLQGYRGELLAQSLDDGFGDVRVRPGRGVVLHDAEALSARLAKVPGVLEATPVLAAPASVRGHGHDTSVTLFGVDPLALHHPYRVIAGQTLRESRDEVLLGASIAERSGLTVGDQVELRVLLSTYPRLVLDDGGYGVYTLTVRGLVGFGASNGAFVSRSFLAGEMGDDDLASAVLVHVRDHMAAPAIVPAVAAAAPGAQVRAWMDDSRYLHSSVRAVETLAGASWLMGVLAVGIPVLALLYISTLNRRRQIGLLTAMGFTRVDLFVTFLLQALILGAAGVAVGGLVAVALVRYLIAHPIFDWQSFVVRPVLTVHDLVRTAVAILGTVLIAGSYPAWRAARLDPSRILRGIE
jgi:ABC-type lipoprotein release transport system permease subunit